MDTYWNQIGGDLKRIDLLTRKDILNIKLAYHINISEGVRHDDDATSVDLWVRECEANLDDNPVIYYKRQGVIDARFNLTAADFCLVVMNNFQKQMFGEFGSNIIAIDNTHGLNNYDFELTTVLVVDGGSNWWRDSCCFYV